MFIKEPGNMQNARLNAWHMNCHSSAGPLRDYRLLILRQIIKMKRTHVLLDRTHSD